MWFSIRNSLGRLHSTDGVGRSCGFLGAAVGGILAAASKPDRSDDGWMAGLSHMSEDIARGGAIFLGCVIVGASLGAILDSGNKWETVSFQHRTFGQMGRTGNDYRLAYGFRF